MSEFGPKPGSHADDCAYMVHKWTCSCEYPKYLTAVEAIAQDVIASTMSDALESGDVAWEDWPELPEFVWDDVRDQVRRLTERSHFNSTSAYRALSALATEEA